MLDYAPLHLISRGICTNRKEHTNGRCPYQKSMYTISGLPVLQLNNSEPETFTTTFHQLSSWALFRYNYTQ